MGQPSNMGQLFDKLNDLKAVFVYGQKIIPVVQSLIDFMKETVPLLENINNSISESTNKIPKATDHINNVTNATELATTEILDIIDHVSEDLIAIEKRLVDISDQKVEQVEKLAKLKELVKGNSEAETLVSEIIAHVSVDEQLKAVTEKLAMIREESNNITLSLQVQDITSQQLAAVNHLIASVQNKLASLITDLTDNDLSDFDKEEPENSTFNAGALYSKDSSSQDIADALINENNLKTSQEEIDKLFK
jgi:chemotaxis regulatin CheY-phosphate phosphatase CheZ